MTIKAKCKHCGNMVLTSEFVLDPVYKAMVCLNCSKNRKAADLTKRNIKSEGAIEKPKPAGWDEEDEQLERAYREKMKNTIQVRQAGSDDVRYTCPKCSYSFLINAVYKKPSRCPFCSSDVANFKVI